MRLRSRLLSLAALSSAGVLFQLIPGGCARFGVEAFLTGVDFCAVFNCSEGTFFNFCDPVLLLVDCL